ncbi:hypothetical protein Ancab_025439 [Ancistrocladus abbreviatus]
MAFRGLLPLLSVIFSLSLSFSHAYRFYVGGKDGWVIHPSEDYSQWAGRNRFLINDILYFKYKKGEDSVLVVNKDDYDSCNTQKPILKLENGDSEFKVTRSGPFFFISGVKDHCLKGQKLTVVVLHLPRPPPTTAPPSVPRTPPTGSHPPQAAPPQGHVPTTPSPVTGTPKGSPAPGASPHQPTPSPASHPPSPSTHPSPVSQPPAAGPSMSPIPTSPTSSPAAAPSHHGYVPATSPTASTPGGVSPVAKSPTGSPSSPLVPAASPTPVVSPAPVALGPAVSPTVPSPPAGAPLLSPPPGAQSPAQGSATSPSPSENTTAPPPSAAPAITATVALVLPVTLALLQLLSVF